MDILVLLSKDLFFLTYEFIIYLQDEIHNNPIINLLGICYTNINKKKVVSHMLFRCFIISDRQTDIYIYLTNMLQISCR